jgi:hypothetical protein
LTWNDLALLPHQIYVLHLTPKEIVYIDDSNITNIFNTQVIKTKDEIKLNVCLLKFLFFKDVQCWTNLIFTRKCKDAEYDLAPQHTVLTDSTLLEIKCNRKDEITLETKFLNLVKQKPAKMLTTSHMTNEVTKLYNLLNNLQRDLSERNEVFVTSWGLPINEIELVQILDIYEKVKKR